LAIRVLVASENSKSLRAVLVGQNHFRRITGRREKYPTKQLELQQEAGIDLIPCNDFSFYDQVLDMTLTLGAIPERYEEIALKKSETDLYFAMARGFQKEGLDITAMEMTKWFDTNYHLLFRNSIKIRNLSCSPVKSSTNFWMLNKWE
jgi:hypothetical protein